MSKIEIYTDGACSNNGQENPRGGWGFAVFVDDSLMHSAAGKDLDEPTNNKMELLALCKALDYFDKKIYKKIDYDSIKVCTDSAYIHNCWKDKWYLKWELNGWRNTKKEPVANRELWEILIPYFTCNLFEFIKVKGHGIDAKNSFVDSLAVNAKNSQN